MRALAAGSQWYYVLLRVREWIRDRFWVVPSMLVAVGIVLAVLTATAENLGVPANWRQGLPIDPNAASTILAIIASSMLTFVGVVFTITLVALQLASAQLSPRVLRTFVRSPVTKLAFGTFLATFAFAFTVLVLDDALATVEARERAVTAGSLLVVASLGLFVVYVTATMRLLQVSWVVTAVADETRAAIRVNLPPADDYRDVPPPVLVADPIPVRLPAEQGSRPGEFGVVLALNRARLVGLAQQHGCVLELLSRVGDYVPTGSLLLGVHGGSTPPARDLLAAVQLGRDRTLVQDHSYGLRQLVDVATQALSPALNQPTTAVQVLDRLEDLLIRAAARPEPTGLWIDDAGVVRLVEQPVRWVELLALAVEEIVVYGNDSPQVARRLRLMLERLAAVVPAELASPVRRRHADLTGGARSGQPENEVDGLPVADAEGARPAASPPGAGEGPVG